METEILNWIQAYDTDMAEKQVSSQKHYCHELTHSDGSLLNGRLALTQEAVDVRGSSPSSRRAGIRKYHCPNFVWQRSLLLLF